MREETCPYFDDCFIVSSLRELEVPELLNYCACKHLNCRYYRSRLEMEAAHLQEAAV